MKAIGELEDITVTISIIGVEGEQTITLTRDMIRDLAWKKMADVTDKQVRIHRVQATIQ